jgi:hypothetical protein
MASQTIGPISVTGTVADAVTGKPYIVPTPGDTDLFLGLSGNFTGLTLQIQGSRGGSIWYDIAAYTTDDAGPFAAPLAPTDQTNIAYKGDIRTWTQFRIVILTISSPSVTLEVQTGSFFPQRPGASMAGSLAILIAEARAIRSSIVGWLGYPTSQFIALPPADKGSGIGGTFP